MTAYRNGQLNGYLFKTTGTSGSFSAGNLFPGTYHLVFEHASTTNAQDVQVAYDLGGWSTVWIVGGIGLIAGGIILGYVSARQRRKFETPRQATGIVMFDQKPADPSS